VNINDSNSLEWSLPPLAQLGTAWHFDGVKTHLNIGWNSFFPETIFAKK